MFPIVCSGGTAAGGSCHDGQALRWLRCAATSGGWAGQKAGDMSDVTIGLGGIERQVSRRRLQLAAAILVLNLVDVVTTKAVLGRGGVEANPIMADLMTGTAAPLALKALVAGVAGALLLCCPPESKLAERSAATVAGLYLAIVVWNSALLGLLATGIA